MSALIGIILFLILLIVGGYYTLRLYSRLTDVNLLKAFSWGFKTKRLELVLPFMLFYVMAFVVLLVIVQRPILILEVKAFHVGGLLEYQTEENMIKVYDPLELKHNTYKNYSPPLLPLTFKDAFSIVSFYKPFIGDYYQNIGDISSAVTLVMLFIGLLGAVLTHFILYALAREYSRKEQLQVEVTPKNILDRFQEMVRLRFGHFLILVIGALILITVLSGKTANQVVKKHEEQYGFYQEEMRGSILRKVAPQDIVKGRLIRRYHTYEKLYKTDTVSTLNPDTEYYRIYHYTLEFDNWTRVPAYLDLPIHEAYKELETAKQLDAYFADDKATKPYEIKEMDFIVNEDYSVSMALKNPASEHPY